ARTGRGDGRADEAGTYTIRGRAACGARAAGSASPCAADAAGMPAIATGGVMAKATRQMHAEHVSALGDEGLARLVKALAFDIPRMQGLLAIARREARRRKR